MFGLILGTVCFGIIVTAIGLVVVLAFREGRCEHGTRCRCDFGPGR